MIFYQDILEYPAGTRDPTWTQCAPNIIMDFQKQASKKTFQFIGVSLIIFGVGIITVALLPKVTEK